MGTFVFCIVGLIAIWLIWVMADYKEEDLK
jgi:hypothetical protein